MRRSVGAGVIGAGMCAVGLSAAPARAQIEQQTLVDRATLVVQEIMTASDGKDPQSVLRRAKAVMVCPRVFRAGFIIGGSGGDCVLSARNGPGPWSYPAFYTIGSGSLGFQIGIQDMEVMIIVLTDRGLNSIMDNQFKLGGDASLAFATLGGGVEGATTPALGADIVVAARSRGLFAGVTLQGSVMTTQTYDNQRYYGRALAARSIVLDNQAKNPGADPLRETLARYADAPAPVSVPAPAGRGPVMVPSAQLAPTPTYPQQPYAPPGAARGVAQQSLPPPARY